MSFIERYDLAIEPWRRGYAIQQRPMPPNMHYVLEIVPGYYDFALLHVDQQSIYKPEEGDRISKGRLYQDLLRRIRDVDPDLPVVVINHMTPFHDKYETHDVIQMMKELTRGTHMVVNSYEARKQWGWGDVITHGLHADEWGFDVFKLLETGERVAPEKEPRCVIVLSPKGMEKAYRREFPHSVIKRLEEMNVPYDWIGMTRKQFGSFDEYRDYLARSLLFFFPAWQSPRPRSRTEAMLSNCCIVSTPYQDADTFLQSAEFKQHKENGHITKEEVIIKDGDNAFLTSKSPIKDPRMVDNPEYTANLIRYLVLDRPDIAIEMGKRARQYAEQHFTHDYFEGQWREFLKKHNISAQLL